MNPLASIGARQNLQDYLWRGESAAVRDLTNSKVEQLVSLHSHRNEWFVRQARLQLLERTGDSERERRREAVAADVPARGRYGRSSSGRYGRFMGLEERIEKFLASQLKHKDEHVRAWAVKLLSDGLAAGYGYVTPARRGSFKRQTPSRTGSRVR